MTLISFGSGSSGNCYYLSTGTDALLIDVGVGIRILKRNFYNYGLSFSSIHNILLTHDHTDHVKSVGSMSEQFHLPVYATQLVHQGIFRNRFIKKKVHEPYIKYVEKGTTTQIGEFSVTPFNVPHDSADNAGYIIQNGGKTLTIITDCGHVTDEMPEIIANTDYLIMEANHDIDMLHNGPYPPYLQARISGPNGHLCNAECGRVIAENYNSRLRHIWLCHLSEKNNTPELAESTIKNILAEHNIIVGRDVELTVLNRTTPTGPFEL